MFLESTFSHSLSISPSVCKFEDMCLSLAQGNFLPLFFFCWFICYFFFVSYLCLSFSFKNSYSINIGIYSVYFQPFSEKVLICFCLSFALHSRRFPWLGLQVAYLFITSETFNQSAILLRFYLVMHAFSSKNVFFFTIYFFFIAACSYFMDMIAYHILERGDINMYFVLF